MGEDDAEEERRDAKDENPSGGDLIRTSIPDHYSATKERDRGESSSIGFNGDVCFGVCSVNEERREER